MDSASIAEPRLSMPVDRVADAGSCRLNSTPRVPSTSYPAHSIRAKTPARPQVLQSKQKNPPNTSGIINLLCVNSSAICNIPERKDPTETRICRHGSAGWRMVLARTWQLKPNCIATGMTRRKKQGWSQLDVWNSSRLWSPKGDGYNGSFSITVPSLSPGQRPVLHLVKAYCKRELKTHRSFRTHNNLARPTYHPRHFHPERV